MTHPYPPRLPDHDYVGFYSYSLEFTTFERRPVFTDAGPVSLVQAQILRAGTEKGFVVSAHCFMPDHLHLVVDGTRADVDAKAFIKAAKQYAGFYFRRAYGMRLWQRYEYERVIRDPIERAFTIAYVINNPVRAGLAVDPFAYPFLGSELYSVDELRQICDSVEAIR
jgi:putative transposase